MSAEQIAGYDIVEPLPSPGAGVNAYVVRRADDDGGSLVVRVLQHHASASVFRRFGAELRAMAAVASPRVVPLVDAGLDAGRLYSVTPWYASGTLDEPASPDTGHGADILAVADAASGAHDLHEGGVLHRNIRPVSIVRTGVADPRGLLGDLGLVEVLWPGIASTGFGPLGTIEYTAPEVLLGSKASRRTDIFALGATLHWVTSGASLYPELDTSTVARAITGVAGTRPRINPACPPPLADVIRRSVHHEPAERYDTAAEFAAAVRRAANADLTTSTGAPS